MKKPVLGASGRVEKPYVMSDWSATYPCLWEHLTRATYECGTVRLTASLTIFVQDGVLKACLNDRDNGRSAFFTAETMELLLENADKHLSEDTAEWKVKRDAFPTGQKPPF